MKSRLIINIKELLQAEPDRSMRGVAPEIRKGVAQGFVPSVRNAYLLIEDGRIADYGQMHELDLSGSRYKNIEISDVAGSIVLPAFCDAHTHIVYAGSREQEFVDKINGLSYKEIAARMAEPEEEWNKLFAEYCEKFPEMKELWDKYYNGCDMSDLFNSLSCKFSALWLSLFTLSLSFLLLLLS